MSPRPAWAPSWVLLLLCVSIGVVLRLVPCLRHADFQWVADAAYHGRLIAETEVASDVPAIDRLSNAPAGRRTSHELPIGLYRVGATFDRALRALGMRDPRWTLALLIALAGGLIAVPAWIGARATSGRALAASLAAVIAVVLPSHLTRSYGYWLRYDAPGTLLIASHAALAIWALAAGGTTRRRALAVASAALLIVALWMWRVTLVVLLLELAFVMLWLVVRGTDARIRDLWISVVVIGTAGVLSIEYLRVQRFVISPLWLASAGAALVALVPPLGGNRRRPVRILAIVAIAGLAIAFGRSSAASGYGTLASLIRARIGASQVSDPATALMREVEEMRGMNAWTFVAGPDELFLMGAWLLATPFLLAWLAGGSLRARLATLEPPAALLGFVTAGLTASTLLFVRTSALLTPFAAMSLGGLGAWLFEPARAHAPGAGAPSRPAVGASRDRKGAGARPARPETGARRAVAIAFGVTLAATVATGATQAFLGWSRLPGDKREALRFLETHTPGDAIVLSLWDDGYDIQAHARRATVVDGLLESVENRRRIVALDRALMEATPDSLERLCDRHCAGWVFMAPASFLHSIARVAGDPVAEKIERGQPLVAGVDTRHVAFPLMMGDAPVAGFRLAHRSGSYRVYERVAH